MIDNKEQIIWDNLTQEDKQDYLAFWFNYYGGELYTLDEYDAFLKIAKLKADDIYEHICTSFIFADTIQSVILLNAMRENELDELLKANLTEDKIKKFKMCDAEKSKLVSYLHDVRTIIITEIAKAYKNPKSKGCIIAVKSGSKKKMK